MRHRRLQWQLYPSYLLITVVALVAASWYGMRAIRRVYLEETAHELDTIARLVRMRVADRFLPSRAADLDSLCKVIGRTAGVRVTMILPSGKVVGDSEKDPALMDNHADRPEVMAAFDGGIGMAIRYSHTLRENMMYVAVRAEREGRTAGIIRTSLSVERIENVLGRTRRRIILAGLIIAFFAAVVSLVVSRRISRPLETMARIAGRFAEGRFDRRMPIPHVEELAQLARSVNRMAVQLDRRVRSLIEQRNEQDAVLSSMTEGVIAANAEGRILTINDAAGRLLEVSPVQANGRIIEEVVRNTDLQQFVRRALESIEPVEGDIVLLSGEGGANGQRFLQVHGTVLRDVHAESIGALVVINDVTRLRRLENVRREFVANVSHELKTPITSIKGFAETLLDGGFEDPATLRRFLAIIARHAERLHSIVEDLLSLSRIEQESERNEILLAAHRLKPSLQAAVQSCEMKARENRIAVRLTCDDDLVAEMNPPLIEQAVVNLLDNAIKFSEPGAAVEIEAGASGPDVFVRVRDEGPGIEAEHLSRIFERFYRVDKGRSRNLGGTGLGLAIVKHIAQAHGGRVTVESTPGRGSAFTIHLRAA